jgi:hypothetical protein
LPHSSSIDNPKLAAYPIVQQLALLTACLYLVLHFQDSWSPEEDAKLRQLHAQYGTSWSRISKNLKGRTSQQCRARWHQINNTRSKSCGSGGTGTPAAAAAGSSGGRQAVSGGCALPWVVAALLLPSVRRT